MGLLDRQALLSRLCPPIDPTLAGQLVDEFVDMERRYIQRDWGPAELDGGRFCEAAARALYHRDSNNLSLERKFDECLSYIENEQAPNHHVQPRSDALHLTRVLRAIYKFRSSRGVAHLSARYSANQMDARLVVETVRWCMNELLRMFATGDRDEVGRIVRELLRFEVPWIGKFGESLLVQRVGLTSDEEILVLLHHAGEVGMTRLDIGRSARVSASSVTRSLQKLSDSSCREVASLPGDRYCLTDLGIRRVREDLAKRLLDP
jgi:hypothetical protein